VLPDTQIPYRTQLELTQAQLRAIDAWNAAQRAQLAAADAVGLTREMRLDLTRRMDARRREQEAVLARAAEQLCHSGELLEPQPRVRAVLAHRNAWLRDRVATRLVEQGVVIAGLFEDGADTAGTVVVEQPDLLLVEDRLPTLAGVQVVRRTREFAPRTVIGVQVLDGGSVPAFVDAGASAVFTRRIPPVEIADQLLACLTGRTDVLTLV
jgi:hypothetical protein